MTMHNQSDIRFQALVNIEANKIIKENTIQHSSKRSKVTTKKASSLADAGETPAFRSCREQALTGGSRPSSHYFPSATISTKE